MLEWLEAHKGLLLAAGVVSLLVVVASGVAVPMVVARIPADYFNHERRPPGLWDRNGLTRWPALRWTIRIGKNVVGGVLILAGIAMLVLPGQGLLTMIVGFLVLDLPGKYRLEKRLVRIGWVRRPIDWLRRRRGAAPLELSERGQADGATEP